MWWMTDRSIGGGGPSSTNSMYPPSFTSGFADHLFWSFYHSAYGKKL